MSHHPSSLHIDREVSADEAVKGIIEPVKPAPAARLEQEKPVTDNAARAQRAPEPDPVQPPARKNWLRRALMGTAAVVVLVGAGYFGEHYWTVGRFEVSTDDAYVQADNVTIAPRVSGYLSEVLVEDNQPVKAGQVLARVDDRDYRVALEQAKADVAAARATIESRQAAIDTQQSIIEAAKATVAVDQANETFAGQERQRYTDLATSGFGSVQNAQQAIAHIAAAKASVERDNAALNSAIKQVKLQKAELAQAEAALAHQQSVQDQAELNLSYTTVASPADGVIGNRTLRVGQYVQAGTQLMSVVPAADAYIVANYKETQLTNVHNGQSVDIEVDMFPGRVYHGRVDSLAPASGQTFALLPPDNATGNFTKVVQRIPVKIKLDPDSAHLDDLRPGMSVSPSIDVRPEIVSAPGAQARN